MFSVKYVVRTYALRLRSASEFACEIARDLDQSERLATDRIRTCSGTGVPFAAVVTPYRLPPD
jgi:hypothetical protein